MNSCNKHYNPQEYWETRLSEEFSLIGAGYIGFGRQYNKWMYKARRRCLDRMLRRHPVHLEKSDILDIGCGTGFYIDYWRNRGVRSITGIDITQKSIAAMQDKFPDYKFIKADICDVAVEAGKKFDIITAFDVLLHIVDESKFETAIANIKKLAKSGSLIFITDLFLKYYMPPRGHEYDRTFIRYKRCLEAYGFQILDKIPVFILMDFPIDIKFELARKLLNILWANAMSLVRKKETSENIVGCTLYLFDGILSRLIKDGPTLEMLICRLAD